MKILIVDDEHLVAKALSRILVARGHEVTVAYNGDEGLEKWLNLNPQIVVVDVVMPGLSGPQMIELYRRQTQNKSSCYIALMSAHLGIQGQELITQHNIDAFVEKPFENIFTLVQGLERGYEEKNGKKN